RLKVFRAESIKDGSDMVGNRTRSIVDKNKVAPSFKEAIVDKMYGEIISQIGELEDKEDEKDIINKAYSCYSYVEEHIVKGGENTKKLLTDNPEIREEVEKRVRAAYGIGEAVEDAEVEDKDEKKEETAAK